MSEEPQSHFDFEHGSLTFMPHHNGETATFDVSGDIVNEYHRRAPHYVKTETGVYNNITRPVAAQLHAALSRWLEAS